MGSSDVTDRHSNVSSDRRRPLTIAVADDVAEIQLLAKTWLSDEGHQVYCAESGRDAVRWCDARRVDVVLTDVMMPEGDGFEVIREVRARHPHVKIISMSGGAPVMSMEQCLHVARALGADTVLRKPFTRSQLLAALAAVTAA